MGLRGYVSEYMLGAKVMSVLSGDEMNKILDRWHLCHIRLYS